MVRLSSQEAPGILLSLLPQLWGYRHVPPCLAFSQILGIPVQVLMFVQQAFHHLSHLSSLVNGNSY